MAVPCVTWLPLCHVAVPCVTWLSPVSRGCPLCHVAAPVCMCCRLSPVPAMFASRCETEDLKQPLEAASCYAEANSCLLCGIHATMLCCIQVVLAMRHTRDYAMLHALNRLLCGVHEPLNRFCNAACEWQPSTLPRRSTSRSRLLLPLPVRHQGL